MSEQIAAVIQVGNMLKERLAEYEPLENFTVRFEDSVEVAVDETDGDVINLWLIAHDFDVATEQWQTFHEPVFEFEVVTRTGESGSLSRDGMNAIANIVAAIAQDRNFGGKLQDCQEVDTGSTVPNGRDVNGASIQFRAEFYTSRDDWFTILTS